MPLIYHDVTIDSLAPESPGAERRLILKGYKNIAESYFSRISSGHKNTVARPDLRIPGNDTVDRYLREMVEEANHNGDCIINVGNGYYRPIPGDIADELELKEYIKKDESRVTKLNTKKACMLTTFNNWRMEANGL